MFSSKILLPIIETSYKFIAAIMWISTGMQNRFDTPIHFNVREGNSINKGIFAYKMVW